MAGTSNGRNPVFPKTEDDDDFDYDLSPYTTLSRGFGVCLFHSNALIKKPEEKPNFFGLET
jgi:hypothetical protein